MTFQMQIRINSSQMPLWNDTIFKSNHRHTQRKFVQIQNHTHKKPNVQLQNLKQKEKKSHKVLTIENQPNK